MYPKAKSWSESESGGGGGGGGGRAGGVCWTDTT
jgi:hypothetical protein